jgi:hypothetical protein
MLNILLTTVTDNSATDLGAPPKSPTTLVFGESPAPTAAVQREEPTTEPL